jgi:hypothetical protein
MGSTLSIALPLPAFPFRFWPSRCSPPGCRLVKSFASILWWSYATNKGYPLGHFPPEVSTNAWPNPPVLHRVLTKQLSFRTACGPLAQVLRLKMTLLPFAALDAAKVRQ